MIYLVTGYFGMYSGAAVVALDLAESLTKADRGIGVICLSDNVPHIRAENNSGYSLYRIPYLPQREKYSSGIKGMLKYGLKCIESSFISARLHQKFRSQPPDLIFFNDYEPSVIAMHQKYAGFFKNVHIVHTSPHFIENFDNKISLSNILKVFEKADALVFVSDECRKKWLAFPKLMGKKTYYAPNCADEHIANELLRSTKSEIREKLKLKPDKFYLISVASLKRRKGQDILIEAAPALKKIAPNLEILILGGGGGEYVKGLKEKVRQQNLDFISFLGHKSNSMEYIYASDTFILTSRAEALPLVILESMVLKTPVLSSDVDGVPEMIEDWVTGRLFLSDDLQSLVQTFRELYDNDDLRAKYTEKASKRYWDYFSNEHFTNRYLKIIDDLSV